MKLAQPARRGEPPTSPELWVSTDEAEDVASSIRHALRAWDLTSSDPQAWKWVILALHSALQGACVCHLLTTASPVGALTKRNTDEWLTYFEESRHDRNLRPPRTELMALPELLKSVRRAGSSGDRVAPAIVINDAELAWLRRLHVQLRNQFVHFEPRGWSVEISGLPGLARLIARVVGEIQNGGWGFRHKDAAWHDELRRDLAALAAYS